MMSSYTYGLFAEQLAINHYTNLGFRLLEHRYQSPRGEIDVIMIDNNSIIFIEVKARSNPLHEEFITQKQIKRCCKAAECYLAMDFNETLNHSIRFDLVVIINSTIAKIYENAWFCE